MKKIGDYPGVSRAHLQVVKNYSSPLIIGPPVCDELVALVEHMFTEEEAGVVQHLKPLRPRTASGVAARSGRPLGEVKAVLHRLAHEKHVVVSFGEGDRERFGILPMVPGTFEMTLMRPDAENVTDWHREFASLFESLFTTGYTVDYIKTPVDPVRYLPVGEVIDSLPQALPSDRLEVILDRYDQFGIAVCQCRLLKNLADEGCGRMLETCTVVGDLVPVMVQKGFLKQASKEDVLEVKAAAEKEGLVTWMVNEESGKYTSALCSCCGCCCAALRTVSEFNVPGFIAPPHFVPAIDRESCTLCEKCVEVCPMGALVIIGEKKERVLRYRPERCIGCGLCAVACNSGSITMKEAPNYKKPPSGWPAYVAKYLPSYAVNMLRMWASRLRG